MREEINIGVQELWVYDEAMAKRERKEARERGNDLDSIIDGQGKD